MLLFVPPSVNLRTRPSAQASTSTVGRGLSLRSRQLDVHVTQVCHVTSASGDEVRLVPVPELTITDWEIRGLSPDGPIRPPQSPQHAVGPVKQRRPAQRLSQAQSGLLFSLIVAAADFHPGKVQMFKFIVFPSVGQDVPPHNQPTKTTDGSKFTGTHVWVSSSGYHQLTCSVQNSDQAGYQENRIILLLEHLEYPRDNTDTPGVWAAQQHHLHECLHGGSPTRRLMLHRTLLDCHHL